MIIESIAIAAFYTGRKAYKRRKNKQAMERLLTDNQPKKLDTVTTPEQQTANRELAIATTSLGLAIAGTFVYTPLVLASVAGVAYLTVPVWQRGYQAVKEQKVKREVLDSVALPGLILTGYVPAAAVGYWVYYIGQKLLTDTKQRTLKERAKFDTDTDININTSDLPTSEIDSIKIADFAVIPTVALTALAFPIAGPASAFIVLDNTCIDGLYINGSLNALNHLALGQAQGLFIEDARVLEQIKQVDTVLFEEVCLRQQDSTKIQALFQQLQTRGISIYIAGSETEPIPTWDGIDVHTKSDRIPFEEGNSFLATYTTQQLPQLVEQLKEQGRIVSVVHNEAVALPPDTISIVWQRSSTAKAQVILLDENLSHLMTLFDLSDQLARQSQRTILATALPSIAGVGSLFFLPTGVYGAVLLYQTGMMAGLGTAMWPRAKEKWQNS